MQAFAASKIFTGEEWLNDHAVMVDGNRVERLIPISEIPAGVEIKNFHQNFIAPAFIDAQVYGAAGKLFSVFPEAATLQLMNEEFIKTGTCLFLPTLATNTMDVFKKGIDAVREYWRNGGSGVFGLHLEGPWINEKKRGAHVKEWIHHPSLQEVEEIVAYSNGVVKMITVAPEVCSEAIIRILLSKGIIVSAGHSDIDYGEAMESFNHGVSTVTHLFNAMSPLHHREPGLVGAALNHHSVMASIIPDGHHVDYAAITLAKRLMGHRLFAITDAVTDTGSGPYQHQLSGDKYEANGVLSGSALSMHKACQNLVRHVGIDVGEALRMCSLYPAQMLRCDHQYGRIAPGSMAKFIVMNEALAIKQVITTS